jgi:hypothetical protein
MQKLIRVWTLILVVMSLWILPAVALTGQIDGGIQINQAICINRTTSTTITVAATGTAFDCGIDFPTSPGDQITIVLAATGGTAGSTGVTGQIDGGIQINQAICVNSITSASSIVPGTGMAFDCSTNILSTSGDQITIVLLITGGPVGPGPGCNTTPLPEQEPNDDFAQSQDIGALQSRGCITVAGNTDMGFGNPDAPDPNADFDYYLFSLVGVSQFKIDLVPDQLKLIGVFDADTQAPVPGRFPQGGGVEIDVPTQTSRIIFRMRTDVPVSYTLTFSDLSNTENLPLVPPLPLPRSRPLQ